jgi:hypothetical protein
MHLVVSSNAGSGTSELQSIDVPPSPYGFQGFFNGISSTGLNSARAGQTAALTFGLGGNRGLSVFAAGYPRSQQIACDTKAPIGTDASEPAAALVYDTASARYTYRWATRTGWAGTCRQLVLTFRDGTVRQASFRFTA